jgi:hypothetical protein
LTKERTKVVCFETPADMHKCINYLLTIHDVSPKMPLAFDRRSDRSIEISETYYKDLVRGGYIDG